MSERLNLTVDDGIGEMLAELAGSRNKMGEAVSNLVRAASAAEQIPAASDVEVLRLMIMGLSAELKQVKRKVAEAHREAMYNTLLNTHRLTILMDELEVSDEAQGHILDLGSEFLPDYGGITDPFTGEIYWG